MLGVATEEALVHACEQRLGRVVEVAATFDLRCLDVPGGSLRPRKPKEVVIALTDDHFWLLDVRDRALWFSVARVLGYVARRGLVAHWHRRWWAWPTVWRAEFSWPESSTYIEGSLPNCKDTEKLIGLLTTDELARELARPAPAPG